MKVGAGLSGDGGARSAAGAPAGLPLPLTSFVGRTREVAEVARLLNGGSHPESSRPRLLTLTGTGGVGKTRLALQAVAGIAGTPDGTPDGTPYPDGMWFVDLAPLADPVRVAGAALAAVGAREAPGQPTLTTLVAVLQPRHALLILDNCEHLVEACARLAAAVLQYCPGMRLLATSREPLGVPGETAWRVPSLTLPDPPGQGAEGGEPAPTARNLEQHEAVRLFVERALAIDPAFRLTDQNAAAVAEVCRRLDGIPLALELAAARVRVFTPEQLAARLGDRFRLLTGGGRTALPRQQTLRATVDWSHDLLSGAERALFRRLAVFAGGFSLEGAEAVCAGGDVDSFEVLDLLTGLVDRSLIVAEPRGAAQRYRLLELLRQYAGEQLALAGEERALRDRHLDWCVALAHGASETERTRDMARFHEAFGRYNAESDNVRAALAWGATTPDGASRALEVLARVILAPHPSQAEKVRWLETLLAASPARTLSRAHALLQLDFYKRINHDFAGARVAVDEARAIAGEIGDEELAIQAAGRSALIAANLGEYALAVAELEGCLAFARERGTGVEQFTRDLGGLALAMGDFSRARALLSESRDLGLARDSRYTLRPRLFLTVIDRLTGDLRGAGAALVALGAEADAWDAAGRQLDRVNFREPARWALANLARDEGRFDEAHRLLAQSLDDLRRHGEAGQLPAPAGMAGMAGLLAIAAGDAVRGVTLLAACATPAGLIGTIHVPELRCEAPVFLARARATLGDAAYAAAWAHGRGLTLQEAVDLALAGPPAVPAPRRQDSGDLSPREAQVAALVARGLTNREIAAELLFTEHTAMRHVEHILGKLGLRNRAQITAWAMTHGLAEGTGGGQSEGAGRVSSRAGV